MYFMHFLKTFSGVSKQLKTHELMLSNLSNIKISGRKIMIVKTDLSKVALSTTR